MTSGRRSVLVGGAALAMQVARAHAVPAIRIGVLAEMSGTYAEDSGRHTAA